VSLRSENYSKTISGVTPTAIIVMAIFFEFTAVTTAMIDERSWSDNTHFDIFREKKYNWL
jgi:hypothetical protein